MTAVTVSTVVVMLPVTTAPPPLTATTGTSTYNVPALLMAADTTLSPPTAISVVLTPNTLVDTIEESLANDVGFSFNV